MRAFSAGLIFFLSGLCLIQAQDFLLFKPDGAGEFFFSSADPVPAAMEGSEGEIVLDYGTWSFILSSGFVLSGRTLVQFFFDARDIRESLVAVSSAPSAGGTEFSRPWKGDSLSYSPLSPDRVTKIGRGKEIIPLSERPSGILTFFETGGDFFWLGNGTEFCCYDEKGQCLSWSVLPGTTLSSAADSKGVLYLAYPDSTVRALSPLGKGALPVKDISYDGWDILSSCYEDASSLIAEDYPGYAAAFESWVRESAETLYRNDPLNRELGAFVRFFVN